jgi:hypothetical protein
MSAGAEQVPDEIVQGADAEPYVDRRLNGIWPEFLLHDKISNRYWGRLYEEYADFQFFMVDGDEILAEANCLPVAGRTARTSTHGSPSTNGSADKSPVPSRRRC